MIRTIWQVIKHDVVATLRERSFWLMTLLMPALLIGLQAYYALENSGASGADYDPDEAAGQNTPKAMSPVGLVDEAGLIASMPAGFPPDLFVPFADQPAARAAMDAGQVAQYVRVPADYVATGQITVFTREFQIMGSESEGLAFDATNDWVLAYLLGYSLAGDEQVAAALRNPTPAMLATPHDVTPEAAASSEAKALAGVVSSVVPYIFYFLLVMGSSYLMRSVVAEKENRTAEVLLLSLNPRDLLVGKILAISVVLVVQLVFWVGGGVLILNKGADLLQVASFNFPPGFFLWAILFLILGYLLFAAVMAAGGAVSSNARETGAMTFVLIIPLMPTLMFGSLFAEEPNNPLVVGLSLFPFSSPSAMVTRLAVGPVPGWQLAFSLVALVVTTYLFILVAARFFQAGNLLSSAAFSWKRLASGWRK